MVSELSNPYPVQEMDIFMTLQNPTHTMYTKRQAHFPSTALSRRNQILQCLAIPANGMGEATNTEIRSINCNLWIM